MLYAVTYGVESAFTPPTPPVYFDSTSTPHQAKQVHNSLGVNKFKMADSSEPVNPAVRNIDSLTALVESKGWTQFGFLVLRTFFDDEEMWARYTQLFDDLFEQGIRVASLGTSLGKVSDRFTTQLVSDMTLANTTPENVALAYRLCAEDEGAPGPESEAELGDLEEGMRTKAAVFIDRECVVQSTKYDAVVFVKAVDAAAQEGEDGVVVKVAVASLVMFYAALKEYEIGELARMAGDGIWVGLGE